MAKFIKAFRGVRKGEIYPTQFKAGDDCPAELERAAKAVGALPASKGGKAEDGKQPSAGGKGDEA